MLSIFPCTCWPSQSLLQKKEVYSGPLPILKSDYWGFLLLGCMSSLYILEINILSYRQVANRLPFHFIDCFFCCAKAFQFGVVLLVYFCFCCLCFWCYMEFFPMFSSRTFTVSVLTFKSLIHFELILMSGIRQRSKIILLHVIIQFSQHYLLKRLSFPTME